jgi:hypothetical protein
MQFEMLDHVISGAPVNGQPGYFSFKEAGVLHEKQPPFESFEFRFWSGQHDGRLEPFRATLLLCENRRVTDGAYPISRYGWQNGSPSGNSPS